MVVVQHIGGISWLGGYAVFGFYILSGYLMTYIMHRSYAYSVQGVLRYGLNRALRIYPMYWMASLLTLLLIVWLGESYTSAYHKAMLFPTAFTDIIKNIFLLFPNLETVRLTPPAWALTVELFFYVLIGLGLSRHQKVTLIWLGVSIIYHPVAWVLDMDRYFSVFAASLPFAMGACLFHFKEPIWKRIQSNITGRESYVPILLLLAIFLNWYVGHLLTRSHEIFFYINCLLCAMMVLLLTEVKLLPVVSKRLDAWLGDFSYSIYLIHYQVALVVLAWGEMGGMLWERPNISLMFASIPAIFLLAWLLVVVVERPIEKLRARVRTMQSA